MFGNQNVSVDSQEATIQRAESHAAAAVSPACLVSRVPWRHAKLGQNFVAMSDLPTLHGQAKRLTIALREGLNKLEATEVIAM